MHVERLEHSIALESKLNSKDKVVESEMMENFEPSSSFLCFLNRNHSPYQNLTKMAYIEAYWDDK